MRGTATRSMAPKKTANAVHEELTPQTRQVIYDAMVKLTYAQGYHGTSMKSVADVAGIRSASIYYHFASKQEILVEIMTRTLRDLTVEVLAAIEECQKDPISRLRAAVLAHVSFHALRREEAFVADSEIRSLEPSNREVVAGMRDRYEAIFSEIMREGQASNQFIVMDERLGVNALMAMCSEVAIWYRRNGRLSITQIAEGYSSLFLERAPTRN